MGRVTGRVAMTAAPDARAVIACDGKAALYGRDGGMILACACPTRRNGAAGLVRPYVRQRPVKIAPADGDMNRP